MERLGMERLGMERLRMEWISLERFRMVRLGMEWLGMVRFGLERVGVERFGMVGIGMVRFRVVRISMEWFRLERFRLERLCLERLGMEWISMVRIGMVVTMGGLAPKANSAGRIDSVRLRVAAYIGLLLASAGGFVAFTNNQIKPPLNGGLIAALVVLVGAVVAQAFPVHIEVGRDTHSFMLHELPLVIAVLTLEPRHAILVMVVGTSVSRLVIQRNSVMKAIFNVANAAIEVAIVIRIVHLLAPGAPVKETRTWLAVLLGTVVSSAVSALFVSGAIRISGTRLGFKETARSIVIGVCGSVAMAMVAITGLLLTVVNVASVVFTVFMTAGLVVGYRRHVVVSQRYQSMLRLERFTRALPPDRSVDVMLEKLLHHAAELMNTEEASITLGTPQGAVVLTRSISSDGELIAAKTVTPGDWVWVRALSKKQAFVLSRNGQEHETHVRDYLTDLDARDLVVAPLHLDEDNVGVLIGRNRRNSIVRMSAADLDLVSTMAHHASVTLERSRLIEKLEQEVNVRHYEATHDSLTGLHNRAAFNTISDAYLASPEGIKSQAAMMLVDLNQFKKINDTMGHHAGDDVLIQIAGRLATSLPPGSTVARLGGDEFAVLVPFIVDTDGAFAAANKLREAISLPVTVDSVTFALDAAIGISLAPLHGNERHTLLKSADIAMYAAKEKRGAPIALFDPSQTRWTAREVGLIEDLRHAIDGNQIWLAYQPKTSLADGHVVGVEALCRWNHPVQGNIRPDEFISLAERAGLIDSITDFVLRTALQQCRTWLDEGLKIGMAVNIPARSLSDPTLAARIAQQAKLYDVPPSLLTLEVTEGELMEDARTSKAVMTNLREAGFRVSIDDFGTGYSSLAYLHTLPVDELKIDRAFVQRIGVDASSDQIVHIIVELAKTFGLRTVAEGIETEEIHEALLELGVELGQGYLMSRPAPAHELTEILRNGYHHKVAEKPVLKSVSNIA
jgi:diguanylate cyclase (GGDEF)-like protein